MGAMSVVSSATNSAMLCMPIVSVCSATAARGCAVVASWQAWAGNPQAQAGRGSSLDRHAPVLYVRPSKDPRVTPCTRLT